MLVKSWHNKPHPLQTNTTTVSTAFATRDEAALTQHVTKPSTARHQNPKHHQHTMTPTGLHQSLFTSDA